LLRRRLPIGVALVAVLLLLPVAARGFLASGYGGTPDVTPASTLEIFYGSPVIALAGETVLMPVDVSCGTDQGQPCEATVSVTVTEADGSQQVVSTPASGDLTFDLSAPTARAPDPGTGSGWVGLAIAASEPGGAAASLPPEGTTGGLRFYVVDALPSAQLPTFQFGDVDAGTEVLYLPWGTGNQRAGLTPGNESVTLGPVAFDVDANGHVFVLDSEQLRFAEFSGGSFLRKTLLGAAAFSDIAVAGNGDVYVASRPTGEPWGTHIQVFPSGGGSWDFQGSGWGIPSQLRSVGLAAYVDLMTTDAWMRVSRTDSHDTDLSMGLPLPEGGELLLVAREHSIRVGTVGVTSVVEAVELVSSQTLGDVPLAEADGQGGYWVITHVAQENPAADQYEILHVFANHSVTVFGGAPTGSFAEANALSRFRLGGDGYLYRMASSADGFRIYRYDLGGA
jgi:hypothetical protein